MIEEIKNEFTQLGVSSLLVKNLTAAQMITAKPIQNQAIPAILSGSDLLGIAQTGSGKTLAFSLPILSKIISLGDKRLPKTARALILAPTRELAVQIEEAIRTVAKGAHIATALVLGGVSRHAQVKRMAAGVDILIATPGRLMDLVRDRSIDLTKTQYLVLDEADRMLDMGFINDVRQIAKLVQSNHQTALFSATMPKEIALLANTILRDAVRVEVAAQGTAAVEIEQVVHEVATRDKKTILNGLLTDPALSSVIVFTRTKHGADAVARHLEKTGYSVAAIHGNKSQNARQKALKGFRDGEVRVLVATDIAARGIDIPGISHVINYDLPDEAESYVHRIGRTGRNGASGQAITLFDKNVEQTRLRAVERVMRLKINRQNVPDQFGPLPEPKTMSKPSNHEDFTKEGKGRSSAERRTSLKRKKMSEGKRVRTAKSVGDTVKNSRSGKSKPWKFSRKVA